MRAVVRVRAETKPLSMLPISIQDPDFLAAAETAGFACAVVRRCPPSHEHASEVAIVELRLRL